MGKLTDRHCRNLTVPGKYADGHGLYLHVTAKGRYWRAAYRFDGKQKTASFGVYPRVSLKDARALHAHFLADLAQGIDPNAARKAAKAEERTEERASFARLAEQWLENTNKARAWTERRRKKITSQLRAHILPAFGALDIRHLRPVQIVELVQGIDRRGTNSTAHDCLDIIRRICAYAVQLEIRETSPAAHLQDILPKKASEPMRHVIAPDDIGRILLTLERAPTLTPAVKAYVRLMPLLFTRPDELRTMRWEELDLNAALWTKPAHTMKKRRVHLIPLPRQALALIEALRIHTGHLPHVFANPATGNPISNGAAQRLKVRNGLHEEITWHGWRHTASTLLNEQGYDRDHIEMQLSHADKNSIRGTYNHAQYLDQRRAMLQAWADWLDDLKRQALDRERH